MQVRAYKIPWGDQGTKAVIKRMVGFARSGSVHPIVRNVAVDILHSEGIEGRDSTSQLLAIRDWLDSNVEFMRDPSGAELVQTPARMIADLTDPARPSILRIDCDDAAVLAAAIGKAMGLRARFVGVGFVSERGPIRHIWTELSAPSGPLAARWSDMDVTRQAQHIPMGAIKRRWIVRV